MGKAEIIDAIPDALATVGKSLVDERGGPRLAARAKLEREDRLTNRQQAFVDAIIANGGKVKEAAKAAGCSEKSAGVTGWKWLRHPLIAEEIARRTLEMVAVAAPASVQRLIQLRDKSKSDFVKMQSAQDLLNRAGVGRDTKQVTAPLVVNIKIE